MIKSLLEPDEPESKEKIENLENESESDALKLPFQNALKKSEQIPMVEALPEKNSRTPEQIEINQPNELEIRLAAIEAMSEAELEKVLDDENLLNNDEPILSDEFENPYADVEPTIASPNSVYDEVATTQNINIPPTREINPPEVKVKDFAAERSAENVRQTGMAWSAAIALFGSILFFMVIGWFANLLLGIAPWGLVGGIVIGGILGFVQFFRINSKIFNPQPSDFERTSLRGNEKTEIIETPPPEI